VAHKRADQFRSHIMGGSMNLNQIIQYNKDGKNEFQCMPSPQNICKSDDDYITYARYAWEAIERLKAGYADIDFNSDSFCIYANHITKDISTAHLIINYCYNYLKSDGKAVNQKEVYTTTISHENYIKRKG